MKTRNKIISVLMVIVFIATMILPVTASAAMPGTVSPMLNNTNTTASTFIIASSGTATVDGTYTGYPNITTGAKIEIKVQRKILFWWSTVDDGEWTDNKFGWYGSATHSVNLTKTGSYRAVFNYTISGSGGSADEIEVIRYADYD